MCQNRTDSQKPLSGAWAKVQGHATAQLQLSNQSPLMCQPGMSAMIASLQLACRCALALQTWKHRPRQAEHYRVLALPMEPVARGVEVTSSAGFRPLVSCP